MSNNFCVLSPADDLQDPTAERLYHSEFTTTYPVRVLRTVQSLLNSGDITQSAADCAERWYQNYIFGYCNYTELPQNVKRVSLTRHDQVSWQLLRAQAMARITAVQQALGLCAHQRLRMMLVDELSFRAMGSVLFPTLSASSAQRKVAAQCAFLLEQLEAFEKMQHKAEKEARKNRAQAV